VSLPALEVDQGVAHVVNVAYGCCVGSWDKFTRYVAPRAARHERRVIATSGHDGIVAPYNMMLDTVMHWGVSQLSLPQLDALVLVHDDLEILDPRAEEKFLEALAEPGVELVGVAGGGGRSLYWWEHAPVGHQLTDVMNIDFGQHVGDVELVEGSVMVLSPWLIQNLRFDIRFTGWHGYDEIGMQVRAAGRRVVVVDVDTHHHNPMGYRSEASAAECRLANKLYQDKWGLT
jgi:hypothetical protein